MDNTNPNSPGSGDEASQHVESSKSHAKKAVDDLAAAGAAKAQELKDAAIDQGQQYYEAARDRAKSWQTDAEAYARKNPIGAMGSALGVGFVLGILFPALIFSPGGILQSEAQGDDARAAWSV